MKTSTRCVHMGRQDDPFGATVPPLYQTVTFQQESALEFGEYDYTRSGNPTRTLLEQQLAELEGGAHASAFSSGMAAITALTRLLETGAEIIVGDDLYGGTVRLLEQILPRQGIIACYTDTTDLDAVRAALTPHTKLILIESPTNPLFRICDIRGIAHIAREAGVLLAMDNSMLSPVLQQPLALGAHVVIHSATKFLCGHSDVTAGAVITNDPTLHQQIALQQRAEGAVLSPFECWLLMRGMKTLALRVERQNASAMKVAEFLQDHPLVENVYYPGLDKHPGHDIHRSQSEGDGAVVSFTTSDPHLSKSLVESTKLFAIAVSFGSVASTISLPRRMSHLSIPSSLRDRIAPPEDLVRISVGIEDVGDLIADLDQAFITANQRESQELLIGAAWGNNR